MSQKAHFALCPRTKAFIFSLLSRVMRRLGGAKRAVAECVYGLGHMHAEPSEVKGDWKRLPTRASSASGAVPRHRTAHTESHRAAP